MKNLFLFILICIFPLYLISSYPWAIRPFNEAQGVSAVLGDGRGTVTAPRFHRGIDIPASDGEGVYSIYSGRVHYTTTEDGIFIGNYWYIHISNKIKQDTTVTGILDTTNSSPTKIGEVSGDHLHFQIGDPLGPFVNPLTYNEGPIGFSDDRNPIVYSIDYWRSGSDTSTATEIESPLWGKIDIRTECQDIGTSGGVFTTSGIYRIEKRIRSKNGGIDILDEPIKFDQVEPPHNGEDEVLLIYDRHNYSSSSPFNYWLTNPIIDNQVEDRYWNTSLKAGEAWNGESAYKNMYAQYPDGEYYIDVYAYDIKGNGGDTINWSGAIRDTVILDNYYPSIDTVEGNETKIIIDGNIQDFPNDRNYEVKDSSIIEMIIRFSEEMDTSRYWGEMGYADMFSYYYRDTTYFRLEGIV